MLHDEHAAWAAQEIETDDDRADAAEIAAFVDAAEEALAIWIARNEGDDR